MLQIKSWTVGPLAENSYLVACADSGQAIFIDPGDEAPRLIAAIRAAGVTLAAILLTHAHLDHVAAVTELREATGAAVYLHPEDDALLAQAQAQWRMFGREIEPIAPAEHALHDGDHLRFGGCDFEVIHTPGHTRGSVCFYAAADDLLFAGDTLFNRSVGRTDLPGGDTATLLNAIRSRLWPLPDATGVYPGHGQATTIGDERIHNPFAGKAAG
jgi:glyoxylase-like metal-dependent hydrolase (beta-lactamase superfamily II)